ncbi:hypothetical protein PIB30_046627 [Stylosanthes scabra]|uniref:Zinc finger GRF-type domain-containing protein n=1 Tax=Stylosanthes scabra TaxID=79078 RepID=A0ABU6VGK1_9FABA|nr:hypothetical protein [Stylosanthes scabra]
MVSQSSVSSRSRRSNVQRKELLCFHGKRPILRVSNTKENPGHRFWGYVYYEVQAECDFFHWADAEPEQEDPEIERLRRKISVLNQELRSRSGK